MRKRGKKTRGVLFCDHVSAFKGNRGREGKKTGAILRKKGSVSVKDVRRGVWRGGRERIPDVSGINGWRICFNPRAGGYEGRQEEAKGKKGCKQ